jgi:hypothetical protein
MQYKIWNRAAEAERSDKIGREDSKLWAENRSSLSFSKQSEILLRSAPRNRPTKHLIYFCIQTLNDALTADPSTPYAQNSSQILHV